MNPFAYTRLANTDDAVSGIAGKPHGKFVGGGTNLIDLMKMGVETPNELLDINRLPLTQIAELPDGIAKLILLLGEGEVHCCSLTWVHAGDQAPAHR